MYLDRYHCHFKLCYINYQILLYFVSFIYGFYA